MSDKKYSVDVTPPASKELLALVPYVEEITNILLCLEDTPEAGHYLKGDLKGFRSLEFALPGSGQYRATYVIIEAQKKCLIFAIGPHEGFYNVVKQRAKRFRQHIKK